MTVTGRTIAENMASVEWNPHQEAGKERFGSGVAWKYAQQVGPAVYGVVTHPGGAEEKLCYADI